VLLVSRRPAARRDVSVAAERTVGRDRDEEVVVGRSFGGDDLRSLVVAVEGTLHACVCGSTPSCGMAGTQTPGRSNNRRCARWRARQLTVLQAGGGLVAEPALDVLPVPDHGFVHHADDARLADHAGRIPPQR
jgi:hypothetical protein